MRILTQWTAESPGDWVETDSAAWAALPPRTLHALCVQGDVFEGADYCTVEHVDQRTCRVIAAHVDDVDWPAGLKWVRVVTYTQLGPRPSLGGAIAPKKSQVIYAQHVIAASFLAVHKDDPAILIRPWHEFVQPANRQHGSWVREDHHLAHQRARSFHGWRGWTEGLDPSELDAHGLVRTQRLQGRFIRAQGTRTYYHNPEERLTAIHIATHENAFESAPSNVANETVSYIGLGGVLGYVASTPVNEPDSALWPQGTYRYQIDVPGVGSDLAFGLLNQGIYEGHFARVNAALDTELQSSTQEQSAFTGASLHLATSVGAVWTAGNSTDRFEIAITVMRVAGHGTQNITLQLGEYDDFADGPWPAAGVQEGNAVFFGCNF